MGAALKHKHLVLDQRKINAAKRYFGVVSEQEAIDKALSLLVEEHQAFRSGRTLGLTPTLLDSPGQIFRALYGNASGLTDRLGPMNDVLIALTAREIGATKITTP